MSTAAKLREKTSRELAALAKKKKVAGWHAMRKEELVDALVRCARSASAKRAHREKIKAAESKKTTRTAMPTTKTKAKSKTTSSVSAPRNGTAKTTARPPAPKSVARRAAPRKDTAHGIPPKASGGNGVARRNGQPAPCPLPEIRVPVHAGAIPDAMNLASGRDPGSDRLVVMVRDPYWLHVHWDLRLRSVERARASLGQHWRGAQPCLRLYELIGEGTTTVTKNHVRDVGIHGGVTNWYVDVIDPPKKYQIEIGYRALGGRFHAIAKSNQVTTPRPCSSESFDENWTDVARDYDRIYAMSGGYDEQQATGDLKELLEERLRRPMGTPMTTRYGRGIGIEQHEFKLDIDTEVIVHGKAEPGSHVTLRGQPVQLSENGSFSVRFMLPDRRHVLPIVACSSDGVEQQTVVLAIDRNTKVMEPVIREPGD